MSGESRPQSASPLAERGAVETVTPLPDDYHYLRISKRAARTLIAAAEDAGAWLLVSEHAGEGVLVISANAGYQDEDEYE